MTRINLLPWREARRKQQQRDFLSLMGGGAIVAVLGVFLAHMQIAGYIEHQETRNEYLQDEIERINKVEKEIQELDKAKARLLGRLEIIQNLQSSRPGMVRVFDALARRLPENIYLDSLTSNGKSLKIEGIAHSNNIVSNFMRELELSPWFGEPVLRVVENKTVNKIRASDFQLTVKQTTQPKNMDSDITDSDNTDSDGE
jgi:type IV pilus assembly protein PilN